METTEVRHAARRAYEFGRVRFGAKLSAAALLAGGVAVGLGRPVAATVALSCALAVLVGLIAFRGGAAGRAIWPALAAGSVAMFFPLALATAGCRLFGEQCMRFCVPLCVGGGIVIGAALGLAARREEKDAREFLVAGAAVAAITAALGCSLAGAAGVLGMAAGMLLTGAPIWLVARAAR